MTAVSRTSVGSATSRTAVVFALLAAAFWGFGIVAAKAALDRGAPPLTLAAVQLVASVAALAPLTLIGSSARQFGRRGIVAEVSLSGALEYGVTATLFTVGMGMTSAGNASLINAAEPVLIIVGAAVLLKERVGARAIILLASVTVGLVLLIGPDLLTTGAPRPGDLFVFAATATGAFYALVSRRLVREIAPLPLALAQQVVGLVALVAVLLAGAGLGLVDLGLGALIASPAVLALIVVSGLLQHAGAVWLHLHALRRMPASAFALFLGLVPVFALIGARAFLGETVTGAQLAGGALVIAAAIFAGRKPPASSPDKEITP